MGVAACAIAIFANTHEKTAGCATPHLLRFANYGYALLLRAGSFCRTGSA